MSRNNEYTYVMNRNNEYFWAKYHSSYGLGDGWVPVSFSLPIRIVSRPSLPDGIVDTIEKYNMIFLHDCKEIPHPRPELDEGPYDPLAHYHKVD
jgi:hypothetical protein